MASPERGVYAGSRAFLWLGNIVGLPVDQVNYLLSQFTCLILATVYRKVLHPTRVSAETRHLVTLIIGVSVGFFLFGGQISYLMVQATLSYVIINTVSVQIAHRLVLFVSLLYLSSAHMMRCVNGPSEWTLDITGPLMLVTQKVISLAFSLHDGLVADTEKLSPEQQKYALRQMPSMLEFYSYIFHFQAVVCGPLVFYNDYLEFIQGNNFTKHQPYNDNAITADTLKPVKSRDPSPVIVAVEKLIGGLFFAWIVVYVGHRFPVSYLADENFLKNSVWYTKIMFMVVCTSFARAKYYVAWLIGDSICNASGLGFNGYTSKGEAKWNMVSNVNILQFELSLNFREALVSWNTMTQLWLKMTAYDRVHSHKTLVTYILSALWHGFFPGYYFTFLTGALFTMAARIIRRSIRHFFQHTQGMKLLYDILSCLVTRIAIAYTVFPFVLLEFTGSLAIYKSLYFFGHILALSAINFLPVLFPPKRYSSTSDKVKCPALNHNCSSNGDKKSI